MKISDKGEEYGEENKNEKKPLKIVWIVLGFLCLGLGTVGIVLPILPTRSVLYGNTILLCKEFQEAARLVHRNEFI